MGRRNFTLRIDEDLLEWLEDQPVIENKSQGIRLAVEAMRKRGALKTLEELQED